MNSRNYAEWIAKMDNGTLKAHLVRENERMMNTYERFFASLETQRPDVRFRETGEMLEVRIELINNELVARGL